MASFDANGNDVEHDYGNLFYREPCGTGERLVIGPSDSHIRRLDELSRTFPTERFYVLYVLLLSHAGREPGRYQSPLIENHEDFQVFLWSFQEFFEGDGRHHVWVASADGPSLLVFDRHNVIYGYGDLVQMEAVLRGNGFAERSFTFLTPHFHSFPPANVRFEDELMSYFSWEQFELQSNDEDD